MLIKRDVFLKLNTDDSDKQPVVWNEIWRQGQIDPYGQIGEDFDFCNRLQEAGVSIYVDLDTTIGHIDPVASWPYRKPDGTWTVALQWGTGNPITLGVAPDPNS